MPTSQSFVSEALVKRCPQILDQWLELQSSIAPNRNPTEQQEMRRASQEFIEALRTMAQSGDLDGGAPWIRMQQILTDLSASRARAGYSPTETVLFVFSLRRSLLAALKEELGGNAAALADAVQISSELLDKMGLFTMEEFQKTREEVISRQQQELLELSTPVVQLWENILALPLIGTLDSARTQVVMQNLLEAIVRTRSDFAIIDITGVPVVDTLVAQHLLKTVAAARLMGADCLISGIRPQIAQTIIHLGVDLSNVTTKATLADAFAAALGRAGKKVVRADQNPANDTR